MQGFDNRQGGDVDQKATLPRTRQWGMALGAVGLVAVMIIAGPYVWETIQNPAQIEAWVAGLGWLGPVALIALNALQIVVAPVPGYVVQVAAGFLYGALWGGVWGSLGLLTGSTLAFWLARIYGRPLAEQMIGRNRLAQWEKVTYSTNTLVWSILLLGPTGDVPYYLAGLSRVSFVKVLCITAILRIPSVFVAAAAGAGVMFLTWWQLALVFAVVTGILLLFWRYHNQFLHWSDRKLQRQLERDLTEESR